MTVPIARINAYRQAVVRTIKARPIDLIDADPEMLPDIVPSATRPSSSAIAVVDPQA